MRTDPLPLLGTFEPQANGSDSPRPSHSRLPSEQSLKFDRSKLSADLDAPSRSLIPRAVVVSGLEYVSAAGQRTLSQALVDKRLILDDDTHSLGGTWNLPDDFIVVYVCASDGRERPPLLRNLVNIPSAVLCSRLSHATLFPLQLDKFALSADVSIPPETRHAYAAYRATYSTSAFTSPIPSPRVLTPTIPAVDSLLTNGVNMSPRLRPSLSLAIPPAPVVSQFDLQYLRALAAPFPSPLAHAHTAMQPSLRVYFSDLFSATRHHPELDGTLLTHRAHAYGDALARAFRVLAGDSIGANLVQAVSSKDEHESDLWDVSEEIAENSESIGVQDTSSPSSQDVKSPAMIDIDGTDANGDGQWDEYTPRPRTESETVTPSDSPEAWDVSEVDIARIFPRVTSHRLRVREGPDEEVLGSLVWPAVEGMPRIGEQVSPAEETWERRTVKEILVSVLADV